MRYYRLIGSRWNNLWENREALDKYLARLKDLMEEDTPVAPTQAESADKPPDQSNSFQKVEG